MEENLRYPTWQKLCVDALMELDAGKMAELVTAAETAIFLRLQELKRSPNGNEERMAIEDGLKTLRSIQRDRLNFPVWKSRQ